MIADLDNTQDADALRGYDLCVIGSGPAGMTLVQELRGSGLRICVLESGVRKPTRHGDRLREVSSDGMPIKDYSRERVFGGASTTWSGLSSPYDEIDTGARPELGREAWPIERSELEALYRAASERYRFAPVALFEFGGFDGLRGKGPLQPDWRDVEEKVFLAASDPQNFGAEWVGAFDDEGIDLWLDATVLQLEGESGASRIHGATVRTRSGREFRVQARAYVVACGGIENARLLLVSTGLDDRGLGNAHDQVGRCFMNHPKNYRGILHLAAPVEDAPYWFGCLYRGYAGYGGLRLRTDLMRERGWLNSYVRLEPLFPWTDNPGIEALVTMLNASKGLLKAWKKRKQDEVVNLRDYSETGDDSDLKNTRKGFLDWIQLAGIVLLHLPGVLHYLLYRLTPLKPKIRRARVRNFMEMEPDPENRVVLRGTGGPYDQPMAHVHHRCTDRDRASLLALHEVLALELELNGMGRLESDLAETGPWPITQDASHHMGTTRMGLNPESSVVDPDLRIHGVDNVWVAGASVFPTSGCANPTYTLVALSIRLAAHLRGTLTEDVA